MRPCFPLSLVLLRSSVPLRFHFPASLGSRRFPVLLGYYGRSDFRRSALRPFLRHEHRTCPGRKFTAYRNNGSCHSVSSHVMCASGIFSRHYFDFFIPIRWLWPQSSVETVSFQSVGSWAQGFACTWHARPSHPTESSSLRGPHGTPVLRTGISFPVALHGRAFPAAVSFHYRLVDFSLTGTCTPLRCYLRSRTRPPLRGLQAGAPRQRVQLTPFFIPVGSLSILIDSRPSGRPQFSAPNGRLLRFSPGLVKGDDVTHRQAHFSR